MHRLNISHSQRKPVSPYFKGGQILPRQNTNVSFLCLFDSKLLKPKKNDSSKGIVINSQIKVSFAESGAPLPLYTLTYMGPLLLLSTYGSSTFRAVQCESVDAVHMGGPDSM